MFGESMLMRTSARRGGSSAPAPTRRPWSSVFPAADARARTDDREAADARSPRRARLPSPTREPTTCSARPRSRPRRRPRPRRRALADARSCADDRQAADPRAGVDDRARRRRDGRHEPRVRARPVAVGSTSVSRAERVADLRRDVPLEHVAVRLQVALGRADVEPVAGQREPVAACPRSTSRGKTSRSIETARPGGTSSSTSGSST